MNTSTETSSEQHQGIPLVDVVGGGLAGCEVAWQLASRGVDVRLREMKPQRFSPAHQIDGLAELVCSNSFRSDNVQNAVGLLHAELRRMESLIIKAADATRVPAGDALAVDRHQFSQYVTEAITTHPRIRLVHEEVLGLPQSRYPTIIATGPLTSQDLAADIGRLAGDQLYFYDAIAPIVAADSIDQDIAFRASRYGKGGGDHYLNLPLDREAYYRFVEDLVKGEKVVPRAFEEARYFEGCLPIEVMAQRGPDCLAYGPMKPVGLIDPRTGKRPYAVVQLRAEDRAGQAYNLVGFQTRLTWPEQKRIFSTLPGLAKANFLRLGQIHRNTFIDSPRLLAPDLSLKSCPQLFFAGQITGVEGYVESVASGLIAALAVWARLQNKEFAGPPADCALGALWNHVTGAVHLPESEYQPSNITFGLFAPMDGSVPKHQRRVRLISRAQQSFEQWLTGNGWIRLDAK